MKEKDKWFALPVVICAAVILLPGYFAGTLKKPNELYIGLGMVVLFAIGYGVGYARGQKYDLPSD